MQSFEQSHDTYAFSEFQQRKYLKLNLFKMYSVFE